MSNCACIKGTGSKFDFNLKSLDCETLLFNDLSNWMDEDGYVIPDIHEITIVPPNSKQEIKFNISPQKETLIKGEDLGLSKCFTDGVYCFTIFSCGIVYTRHAAVTCTLNCRLDTLISQARGVEDFDNISKIKNYINSINVNARMGKPQKAADMFKIAKKELDNLNCDC